MSDTTPDSARRLKNHREYRRAYKACETCRKRKSRCQISAEEYAAGLPCARCRREMKQCEFPTATSDLRDNATRRAHSSRLSTSRDVIPDHSNRPKSIPTIDVPTIEGDLPSTVHGPKDLVSPVMRTVVSSGDDALNLLFRAAQDTADGEENFVEQSNFRNEGFSRGSVHGLSPATTKGFVATPASSRHRLPDATSAALDVWRVCRFVKQGWFSAAEAVLLMDLFFQRLAPFTPILTNYYQDHANHFQLITQEPVLCCMILTISSRYNLLPGLGTMSRSYMIHERLWDHCQHLVLRIMLGQEKGSDAKTRTLGTIQGLLLLIEWNPRRMHFPPANDGWDSDLLMSSIVEEDERNNAPKTTARERWLEDVINPARRSGRMSWMLAGCAMSLAFELGILDDDRGSTDPVLLSRVKRLLYLYAEQLSSRLGLRSMIPQALSHGIFSSRGNAMVDPNDDPSWHACVSGWMELSKLVKSASDMLFPSPAFTTEILQSGRYVSLIGHFKPLLSSWFEKFGSACEPKSYFSDILFIEYQSARIFTSALGLQAVVERTIAETSNGGSAFGNTNQFLVDATDYEFIQDVVDSSLEILKMAIRLAESGRLVYAPVRIFLRLTSASIHLLKGIGIGVGASKLRSSLQTLNKCISCLRSSAPDDMHLGSSYATLLEIHVNQLQERFIPTERPPNFATRPPSLEGAEVDAAAKVDAAGQDGMAADGVADVNLETNNGDLDMYLPEEWLTLPFDSSLLPLMPEDAHQGYPWMADASLDFIWNLQY